MLNEVLFRVDDNLNIFIDRRDEQTLYKAGLDVNPNNVKLLNNFGKINEDQENYGAALGYYSRATELHPDDVRGYFNLGNVYAKLKRLDQAEMYYRKAVALFSESTSAGTAIREEQYNGSRIEKTMTIVHLQAFLRLASLISLNKSRLNEADKMFADVLQIKPDYKVSYLTWTENLMRYHRYKEARTLLSHVLKYEHNKKDPELLYKVSSSIRSSTIFAPFF